MYAFSFGIRKTAQNCPADNDQETAQPEKYNSAQTPLNTTPAASSQIQDVRLRRLLQLIESDPLGKTQEWALAFNLSHSHLQHLFKQATGMALGQAISERRLQKAAQLLANTTMSIKEIAFAVGYEHTSSFTRAFEKRFEQAPRRYRMRNAA